MSEAVDAGAQYLVSPGTSRPVAEAMRSSGTPFAIGALTPSEVMAAGELGADLVKLFPGSLGGPSYLKALRGPFPDVPFMPTGGVSVDNARSWLDAGAVCLGAGSDLLLTIPRAVNLAEPALSVVAYPHVLAGAKLSVTPKLRLLAEGYTGYEWSAGSALRLRTGFRAGLNWAAP